MSIALYRKTIHCPQCHYEGSAKVKGTGWGLALFGFIVLICGFYFWPLFLVAVLLFIVAILRPAKQICPKCKWEYPLPRSQYEQQAEQEKACPYCAEKIRLEAIKCRYCNSDLSTSNNSKGKVAFQTEEADLMSVLGRKAGRFCRKIMKRRHEKP
jgi:DNA-directed RNA polymerase subunit RPC12/RpoP